jgi:PhnB protein
MSNQHIPENYQHVMPYIIVKDADGFSVFVQQVLDGKETMRRLREDGKIMHGEIKIGNSTIMFAESTDQWGANNAGMFVYVTDADVAYQKALDAGATSIMPPADQSYGRSSGVTDPFGNTWWITSVR